MSKTLSIYCEICSEKIATAEISALSLPLKGSQFLSPDAWHGYPPPFEPEAEWEEMRCPHCRRRPFISETAVKTANGMYEVPRTVAPEEVAPEEVVIEAQSGPESGPEKGEKRGGTAEKVCCPECGREFQHRIGLSSHMKKHRRDGNDLGKAAAAKMKCHIEAQQ